MKLAKVESASLEIKERGILNFWVQVAYEDGFHQAVGGLTLDDWDKRIERRVGTAYGCEMIRQLLLFFGVNNLNEAKDQVVYVVGEGSGLNFKPTGFKHLHILKGSRPEYICFNEIAEEFIKENK